MPTFCDMKRKRLTREQRRDETRERLLAAARENFIKKGYAATCVEDIALAAGYTRGAFYSNFGGKLELLIELLRRDHDATHADLLLIIEGNRTDKEMEARVVAYYSQMYRDHGSFPLWVEARLLARCDIELRERLSAFTNEKLDQAAACIRAFSERVGTPLPLPEKTLALGLLSLCDGVHLFQMCDPQEAVDEVSEAVLAGFFSRVISR
jgi:AcrR family transcriptional regulator